MFGKVDAPLKWENETLYLLDQRALPIKETYINCRNLEETHSCIKEMVVRGAPLIGFTAIWGLVLWVKNNPTFIISEFEQAVNYIITARPTAVNLEFEARNCLTMGRKYFAENDNFEGFYEKLKDFALCQMQKLYDDNIAMAKIAEQELQKKFGSKKLRLMTLCNTGYLACGPMGTALGVISYMHSQDKLEHAYASETRPYLQGSRLTAYEMAKEGIEHNIVVEGAASYLLQNKLVDAIFIGADRIAANGDTANKIGSSSLAIIAQHYGVPFYVVAPTSSFDLSTANGDGINIELRPEEEILQYKGVQIAPKSSTALNPSFDVTSNQHITGIICEKGLIQPVDSNNLSDIVGS